jgi:DNA-binding NarL/FixJ family response regulator/DNA invertase Pin-like site-specific DNA recombinase
MSEITINKMYDVGYWVPRLQWVDGKPVVIAYCRVSTDEQAEEGFSLENQPKWIREWAIRKLGKGKFHLIIILEDESGTLPHNRGGMTKGTFREGLTLAAELCNRGMVNYLAVYKLSRLARKARIFHELDEDYLRPNDVELVSVQEGISNRNHSQRFIAAVIAACAENERDSIVSYARDGLRARQEKLYHIGQPPFGWRWDDARPPRKDRFNKVKQRVDPNRPRRNIEPDPNIAPHVKKAYEWAFTGKELRWIAAEFERLGVRRVFGGRRWTAWSIKLVLRNPTHAGLVRIDGELVEGRHFERRIVETEVYWAVVNRLEPHLKVGPTLRCSPNHIFGELTRCGLCSSRMLLDPRRVGGSRYHCPARRSGGKHDGYGVKIAWVENRIVEQIRALARDTYLMDSASGKIAAILDAEHGYVEKERARLERERDKAKADLIRWCERQNREDGDGEAGPAAASDQMVFTIYKDRLVADIATLDTRLGDLESNEITRQVKQARLDHALSILRDFDALWEGMSLSERKTFASYVVESLVFEPNGLWVDVRLKLLLREEVVLKVPRRGRGGRLSDGIDSLSRMELTAAYYYLQGYSDAQIAQERDVCLNAVLSHRASLIRRTGAKDLNEALALVASTVEARKDELLIGVRRGRHYKEYFTDYQVSVLRALAEGLSVAQIAEQTGTSVAATTGALHKLYRKLDVHSARQAVIEARKKHLIPGTSEFSDRPTPNQLAVLRLLDAGMSQPKAAAELDITQSAAKTRMRCLYNKFGIRTQAELLSLAHERGWLP